MTPPRDERPASLELSDLEGRIADAVAAVTGQRPSQSESELSGLGLDSLALLELLAVLEERFQVELAEDVLVEFKSIKRIAELLRETNKRISTTGRGVDWGW